MRQHFHLPPATLAAAQPPAHIAQVTTQIVSLASRVELERVDRRLMAAPLAPDVQRKRMADEVAGGVDALFLVLTRA